jgi:hypothetical protein
MAAMMVLAVSIATTITPRLRLGGEPDYRGARVSVKLQKS